MRCDDNPLYKLFLALFFVGESGLGKSTLLNSLFLTDIYTPAGYPSVEERLNKTVSVSNIIIHAHFLPVTFKLLKSL